MYLRMKGATPLERSPLKLIKNLYFDGSSLFIHLYKKKRLLKLVYKNKNF